MNKTLNYIQSITALLIIRYYILVAEVGSCLSSAGNTVATEFFCKNTCSPHGFAGLEALVPFHLLLGSTSLPALTYASDRVTDVISVMCRQSLVQRVMSAVCLS